MLATRSSPPVAWPFQVFYAFASFGMALEGACIDEEEIVTDEFGDLG